MDLGTCLAITHPARLGDSVMALPLHRCLALHHRLDSNVGEPYRFLFTLAGVEVGHAGSLYPKRALDLLRTGRELRGRYQTAFLIRPNFRSALMARAAGIPIRVGDAAEGRGRLLTHVAQVPAGANQLQRLAAFGAAVGLDVGTDFGLPKVARCEPPLVGIAPAASYEDKMVPPGALREVAQRLKAEGYRIALVGGPGHEPWNAPLADLADQDWVGKYSLPDLIAPLSSLRALVASDGGLYHLAVGCGVPSVGVYGPTAHRCWWHAWGPHTPVLAPEGKLERVTAEMIWDSLSQSLSKSQHHP